MATILNSGIMDSAMLHKTLTPTNSIWLKLICSDWTWCWQPSWILQSWIQLYSCILTQIDDGSHLEFCHLRFSHFAQIILHLIILTQLDDGSHLEFCQLQFSHFAQKRTSLIHSDSTWWWQPSWILPCWIKTLPSWIQTPCHLLSGSFKNTLTSLWLWLKLIQYDSNSFILTHLDGSSHLEFCHLQFSHFAQKRTSLIHFD